MSEFLDLAERLKLNQGRVNNVNRHIRNEEIEIVITSLPSKKVQSQMDSQPNSTRYSKIYSQSSFNYLPKKKETEEALQRYFYKANITLIPSHLDTKTKRKLPVNTYDEYQLKNTQQNTCNQNIDMHQKNYPT